MAMESYPRRPRQRAADHAAFASRGKYLLVFCFVLLIYAGGQIAYWDRIFNRLDLPDNDDIMRLLLVRDWLAGQSWFDMTQYRAVPGEGVSMHWSRYIDAALGSMILGLIPLVGQDIAERLAVVVWPFVLFIVFLLVSGRFAHRLFGWQAASFTLMAVATVPAFQWYFQIGRIDHHNVQMIAMMAIAAAVASNASPLRMGSFAGVISAFSLAIGLESLLHVAVSGLILVGLYVLWGGDERRRLVGFGIGLGLTAPLFHIGQTAPGEWFAPACDKLSLPFLIAAAIGGAFTVIIYLIGRSDRIVVRAGLVLIAGAVALLLIAPQVLPCASGPYGNIPEGLRIVMLSMIVEAVPLPIVVIGNPPLALAQTLPAFTTLLVALLAFWGGGGVMGNGPERRSFAVLLIFLAISTAGFFYQVRMSVWVYAVQPLVFGATVSWLWRRDSRFPGAVRSMLLLAVIVPTLFAQLMAGAMVYARTAMAPAIREEAVSSSGIFDEACRSGEALRALNTLPPSIILSSINIGPLVLLHTHHGALVVPFHRSVTAVQHGFVTFLLGPDTFEAAVRKAGVHYILVCRGNRYGEGSVTQDLALEKVPDWLELVSWDDNPILLYRVLPARAGAE